MHKLYCFWLAQLLLLVGCVSVEGKCALIYINIEGNIADDHYRPEADDRIVVEIQPETNASGDFILIDEDGHFGAQIPFDTTRSGGRFHHDCSRRPNVVTVTLLSHGQECDRITLDIGRDFIRNDEGDCYLISPIELRNKADQSRVGAFNKEVAASHCEETDDLWDELLNCDVTRSDGCRARISELADRHSEARSHELAAVLLEEWDLRPEDRDMTSPRLVWSPELTKKDIEAIVPERVEWAFIVIGGRVDCQGRVHDAKILRSSRYQKLDERVLQVFSSSCYRPARGPSGFVSSETTFSFRLEPR